MDKRFEQVLELRILVGISSCLIGERVRYDGGHKHNAYITDKLGAYFEFVPICPEVAIGMGIPREPIRLVKHEEEIRAEGVRVPKLDVTDALRQFSKETVPGLTNLSGYILKRGSPSCGMERVKVYSEKAMLSGHRSGIYADILMRCHPLIPVEEEGRLGDPVLRENFIERVFVYHRWQCMAADGLTPAALVDFHARHKLLIMSHSQAGYRKLGRMVASAGVEPIEDLANEYVTVLMRTAKRRATKKSHANV